MFGLALPEDLRVSKPLLVSTGVRILYKLLTDLLVWWVGVFQVVRFFSRRFFLLVCRSGPSFDHSDGSLSPKCGVEIESAHSMD